MGISIAHSAVAITNLLRHGTTPVTDNRDALLELGFERAYPQIAKGFDATIWERSVELPGRSSDGLRRLARERVILRTSRKTRPP